ncbi:putative methyltransferase [Thermosulfurimonas marina]|uniref:N(4)-bis(aminopropyl)spermidine synthase n=1 Tax=Thermosulfurimonas marina TaxID=2047767 RepID=A0A6H1WTV2_9BACT|nr:bis-aminopropyl spermidine synthase family protein [Thermosulfurimonas marina]QJA06546.1 putative methyltransferase [Thermosulfurimonas marina]
MSETERIKKQILRALKLRPQTFWELINHQDGHIAAFFEALKSLLQEGLIVYRGHRFQLAREVPLHPLADTVCEACGLGVTLRGYWEEIYRRFLEVTEKRPLPTSDFDQGFVRPVDTVRRVAYIYQRGDLEDTEIFILGDDDLLSVAMGLTRMPRRVVVVEIDERINRFIKDFAEKEGLSNLEVYDYNVIEALPEPLKGAFDVFVTDPVETKKGLKLFVGRCLEALRGPGAAGYMGFTHREASLRKWFEFEKFILSAGLVVTDILRDFAIYPEKENRWEHFYETYEIMKKLELPLPEVDWYKSSFVRFEVVEGPRVPEFEPPRDLRELYFDEESWATPLPSYLKDS